MVKEFQCLKGKTPKWWVIGGSVIGASHQRSEDKLPNQDAIWLPERRDRLPLILAVSDGHGSPKFFRSHIGSRLAVQAAVAVIERFLAECQPDPKNHSATKRLAEEQLPKEIVRRWIADVDEDWKKDPLHHSELELLRKKESESVRQAIEANLSLAYGATILAAVVAESFILYLQLGDGDILSVSDDGEVTRPLPPDKRLFANETTSLCSECPWNDFRVGFQVLSGSPPALILVSSDGYSNSFQEEKGFLKVGTDILEMLRTDGLEKVDQQLQSWLAKTSEIGSGDDITLGIICQLDALASEKSMAKRVGNEFQGEGASVEKAAEHPEG